MKVGVRKPNIKNRVKSRTTGRAKRAIKSSANPLYGKKGMGFAKDPEQSIKNSAYHRSTWSAESTTNLIVGIAVIAIIVVLCILVF